MSNYDSYYQNLVRRLSKLRTRQKQLNFLQGSFWFVLILITVMVLSSSLEAIFRFNPTARFVLIGATGILAVGSFFWFLGRPLFVIFFRRNSPDDISLALTVGEHYKKIRDRLADALQVFQKHTQNREGYSLELADASLAGIHEETAELNFETVADAKPLKKAFKFCLGAVGAFALLLLIFPSTLTNASYRLLNPTRDFAKKSSITFWVEPGDTAVVKGKGLKITARVSGTSLQEISLFRRKKEAKAFEHSLLKAPNNQSEFAFDIENISQDFSYYFEAANRKSDQFNVTVLDLPFVRNLQVKLTYPTYSKLGTQFLDENVGDVSALMGTKVSISAKTNKIVQEAKIQFDDGKSLPLRISGQDVSGEFSLRRSGTYHFSLLDKKALRNAAPIEYRLSVIADQNPMVQITFPGQDVDIGKDLKLPLSIEAQDDYGFSKLRLGYRIIHEGTHEGREEFFDLALPENSSDNLLVNETWDLTNLNLFPQDVVTYYAEAFDNDRVSGPKSARSQTYRLRFPSIYELYDEVARGQDESFEDLQQLYEESKTLKSTLDEIVQQMKRDADLDWEEQQEVQDAVKSQQDMQEKLRQVQEKLDQIVNRMEQNDLVSMETLQKYRELQQLMQEMLTPELREALQKLQQSMEELDPQKMKQAMEKFVSSQEEFMRSMERTLNLLKKLQVEQQLDEATRKAQELRRRQEELNRQVAENSSQQQSSKYSQEQSGIRNDTENLEQELDQLQNNMSEFPKMPQSQIDAAKHQISQNLKNKMQQAAQQFQSGNMSGGKQSGEQISQDLQQLMETLQSAQQQLSEQQKKEIMQALKRSSRDLLNLSKRQENLMESTKGTDRNTPGLRDLADQQQDMLGGLSRIANNLYELSQETFFVTPEMGKALGKSMQGMQGALKGLEERNSGKSTQSQSQAMEGLNEAVSEVHNSMQGLSAASSAIGFEEMMQRLMGISQQQQGINQQTSQMGESPGGLSPAEQAAMRRLASEQGAVRKSLEQLLKEAGNHSETLGDLNQVSKDMEEVVKELQRQNLNRTTINRQQRILSRLLDAQRSMNRRDYSKQRQAETGKQYEVISPNALPNLQDSDKDRLRNELLRAMREGYSKDYKELIRKYFEALTKEQEKSSLNN